MQVAIGRRPWGEREFFEVIMVNSRWLTRRVSSAVEKFWFNDGAVIQLGKGRS